MLCNQLRKIIMFKLPRTTIRNTIILLLSIAVVIATQVFNFSVNAETLKPGADNEYSKIFDENNDINEVIDAYNEKINDMFNANIKAIVKLGNSNKPEDLKRMLELITPPSPKVENGLVIGREECEGAGGTKNLSTYCLSVASLKEYFAFRDALNKARSYAQNNIADTLRKNPESTAQGSMISAGKGLASYGDEMAQIDREIAITREALDKGLAAYSELQMALPLHQKYKQVIKALESYRDKISDIRKQVDLYPFTFLDVTTTSCT